MCGCVLTLLCVHTCVLVLLVCVVCVLTCVPCLLYIHGLFVYALVYVALCVLPASSCIRLVLFVCLRCLALFAWLLCVVCLFA